MSVRIPLALAVLFAAAPPAASAVDAAAAPGVYARDPAQAIDQAYTDKIREYTTDPSFNSPLTDYLPAAPGVPTPPGSTVLTVMPCSASSMALAGVSAASAPLEAR